MLHHTLQRNKLLDLYIYIVYVLIEDNKKTLEITLSKSLFETNPLILYLFLSFSPLIKNFNNKFRSK